MHFRASLLYFKNITFNIIAYHYINCNIKKVFRHLGLAFLVYQ